MWANSPVMVLRCGPWPKRPNCPWARARNTTTHSACPVAMAAAALATAAEPPPLERRQPEPQVDLRELLAVFAEVVRRAEMFSHHAIQREPLSVRQRMSEVLAALGSGGLETDPELFNHFDVGKETGESPQPIGDFADGPSGRNRRCRD